MKGFHPKIVHPAAEEQDISTDKLGDTIRRIRNYTSDNVEHYLHLAWHIHHDEVLLGDVDESYIIALTSHEWEELADQLVFDDPTLKAVKTVHREHTDDLLDSLNPSHIPEDSTPFVIDYPENWARARENIQSHWGHFFSHGFSPAEAIDYWMTQKTEFTPENWAKVRDVQPEAVRKNVRQAKDKLPHELPL